ncbi:MAG TPA: aminoglycoside phosphotransferase family protein [Dongiaceae bacterium]|nr:aminoglycoside phosphotransferase family protein [Dongiaceae bacterium]
MTPARSAELVLVTPTGDLLGRLPPVAVETPWWQDVEPVVRAIRARDGIAITVLRLLDAEHDRPPGGRVTYLAETADPVALLPWSGALDEQPLRQAYAKPGGPAADLAWAESVIAGLSPARTGPAVQIRTWNLSSLWRVPVPSQTLWLKVVPAFFAHEGALLERLAGERVPRLLGRDGGRMLLAEIAGADLYEATLPQCLEMVNILVGLQRCWMGRAAELDAIGLPDWRGPTLTPAIADVVTRTAEELPAGVHAKLERFLRELPARFAALSACGLGDGLVHGDFHPGNFRGHGSDITLLDWGDSGIGHPLLDQAAFLDRVPEAARETVRSHWLGLWRAAVPGSDPARAAALLAPIAAARQAVIYRRFLDHIEPAERPYHRHDPAEWLGRVAALEDEASL